MTLHDAILLALAAFGAGMLNTVAGGGTFLTFPALVMAGIPPVAANATSAVAVFPGYLAGAMGFRHEIGRMDRAHLLRLCIITLVGGLAGSLLLMVSSNETFSKIVPGLLLFATVVFLFGDRLRTLAAGLASGAGHSGAIGLGVVSLYGGYFNGGLGIMLLAAFSLLGHTDLHGMNGLKNLLSAVLSLISAGAFIWAGLIAWEQAFVMAASTAVGGYVGARLSRRIVRTDLLRWAITMVGAAMTVAFFLTRQ